MRPLEDLPNSPLPIANLGAPQGGPTPLRHQPIQFVKAPEPSNDDTAKKTTTTTQKRASKERYSNSGPRMPRLRVNEYGKSYVDGLDDEDWVLCDKACVWCGHCADGVDF